MVKWSMCLVCLYDIDKIITPTGMAYNIGLARCGSFSQKNPKVVVAEIITRKGPEGLLK